MILASTVLLLVVLLAAALVVGMRRWAVRVEHGPQDVPDKVHRLQRGSTFAVLGVAFLPGLVMTVVLAVIRPHRRTGAHGHVPLAVDVLLIAGPVLMVALIVALSRAARPSVVRLRGLEPKVPGRDRAQPVSLVLAAGLGALVVVLTSLVPGHGPAHLAGVVAAYLVALVAAQALLAPVWLVALRARPLEPAQRERLLALADRLGVQVRDIQAFPGRSQKVANALQIGLVPRLRYVLVSEYLLDAMTDEQVDAVVAHELGHARGHHLLVKLGAVALLWGGFSALSALLRARPGSPSPLAIILPLALPVSLLLVQGLVGVRLERRADAAAARDVSPGALAAALERLGDLNDTKRRTGRLWGLLTQHPGLEERIAALEAQAGAAAPALP